MKKKIFIGPSEVSGYYSKLAKGLREIGYDVSFFVRFRHKSGYPIENKLFALKLHRIISDKRISIQDNQFIKKIFFAGVQWIFEGGLFVYFILTHRVFIFTFMETYFRSGIDLRILKLFNKRMIMVSNGSDLRPPYLGNAWLSDDNKSNEMIEIISKKKKLYLKKVEKYVDIIVGGILRCHFLEKPFIERSFMGRPVETIENNNNFLPSKHNSAKEIITILHAPSARNVKGTDEIIRAVENIKAKGFRVNLEIAEHLLNSQVLESIKSCDIVIDQLYSDILLPAVSSEAAMYGKAVLIAGYELDVLKKILPRELVPPVYTCKPEEIEDAIIELVTDENLREKVARNLNYFIKTKYDYRNVASNYKKIIENEIPKQWYIDPYENKYVHGVGLNKDTLRKKIGDLIIERGIGALQIEDKPLLKQKFIDFVGSE